MDFAWSAEDLAFKEELEAFLDKEMPPFIELWSENEDLDASRGVMGVMDKRKAWQNKLNEGRWAAILWPEEWGGRAATTAQQVVYTQVMAKYRSPGIFNANGIVQIGPSIISWGTDDQKARWLPGHPRRERALVSGVLGTAGRIRPREPAHHRDPLR